MNSNRGILAERLETYEDKLRGVSSYVKELKTMTAKCNTPNEQFESDLNEALHNIGYYEAEIARLRMQPGTAAPRIKLGTVPGTLLPSTRNQGIGAIIFSSISFAAGAIMGSLLKSGKSNKDRESGN